MQYEPRFDPIADARELYPLDAAATVLPGELLRRDSRGLEHARIAYELPCRRWARRVDVRHRLRRRLDGRLAGALCSIQAVKGVSLGDAFEVAGRPGSQAHDEIFYSDDRGFYRETNHSGGLEGGMTTGEALVVRAAMKPLPTLTKPLRSVDIATHEPAEALRERTDSVTVPAAGVVGEAMVAFILAGAYRDKFGGDHVDDALEAVARYEERIGWRRR